MTRPGVEIRSLAQAPPRSAPTDTGVAFMVGPTASGTAPAEVRSLADYETAFGTRSGGAASWDAADVYFREGGSRLIVSPAAAGAMDTGLDALTKDYGPGQVFATGTDSDDPATHALLLQHAADNNRVALISPADGDAATLEAAATALQADANARYGALFAPQAEVPGIAGGTTRTVPYAPLQAGIISRNEGTLGPNVPSAGDNGRSQFALDLTTRYTDAEYEALNLAGADMARVVYGQVETYGYRSLVDPNGAAADWLDFGNVRLNMVIVAQAGVVAERYVFSQIDGGGKKIAQFGGDLRAMLVPFYERGSLFGESAEDAFAVDVGPQVNTDTTIAAGELHAVISVRMSPYAEMVVIEIVKVQPTAAIAA